MPRIVSKTPEPRDCAICSGKGIEAEDVIYVCENHRLDAYEQNIIKSHIERANQRRSALLDRIVKSWAAGNTTAGDLRNSLVLLGDAIQEAQKVETYEDAFKTLVRYP